MGLLQNGVWVDRWYDTSSTGGRFERSKAHFRNWITRTGKAGPTGEPGFKAEKERYHLYVSLACPWAHRTLIFRKLKGLEDIISFSTVHWLMVENGWVFNPEDDLLRDGLYNYSFLHQIYTRSKSDYSGRVTVPVLWDKQTEKIVSNESADIIRMFNFAFEDIGATKNNFYPADLQTEIDELNEIIYRTINNGVYRCGFATSQTAYDEAIEPLFSTLDWLEQELSTKEYLCGSRITEADWRLFTTLIRFDPVYVGHFKCNVRRIVDYKNISKYLSKLYNYPGILETIDMMHIKNHYYLSHKTINPSGVVPVGPA